MRLDDPLFPIGIHEDHRSLFARALREDRSEAWEIAAHEYSSVWVPRRPFRDPVLDRGVEPLRGKHAAWSTSLVGHRRHDSIISR
jgi:hypothetical protein